MLNERNKYVNIQIKDINNKSQKYKMTSCDAMVEVKIFTWILKFLLELNKLVLKIHLVLEVDNDVDHDKDFTRQNVVGAFASFFQPRLESFHGSEGHHVMRHYITLQFIILCLLGNFLSSTITMMTEFELPVCLLGWKEFIWNELAQNRYSRITK